MPSSSPSLLKVEVEFFFVFGIVLLLGIVGIHFIVGMTWLDSLYNSCMMIGGMGLVPPEGFIVSPQGKWFLSFYALICGIVILIVFAFLLQEAVQIATASA